jgi:hypothetical protein
MPSVQVANYDIDAEALNLRDLLSGVLERVESVYTSFGVPLPTRRYYTIGQPVIDCEQLTVSFLQGYLGPPGDQASGPQRCNMPRTAVMSVDISRPIPVIGQNGGTPTAELIQGASDIALVDAWVLLQSLNQFDYWDEDLGSLSGPGVIATVEIGAVQGGYVVTTLSLTMAIP